MAYLLIDLFSNLSLRVLSYKPACGPLQISFKLKFWLMNTSQGKHFQKLAMLTIILRDDGEILQP